MITNTNEINLGRIDFNSTQNFKYVLTNDSNEEVSVPHVSVGCKSCTIVKWDKKLLNPNESVDIEVEFTPGDLGRQDKKITVIYTEKGNTQGIELKFNAWVI